MTVVRAIKSEFPGLTIEAHDRIAGEFLPLYYQHGTENAHDELWGFEYMWDPVHRLAEREGIVVVRVQPGV